MFLKNISITRLTNTSSLALVAGTVIISVSVFMIMNELRKPYEVIQHYSHTSRVFDGQIRNTINQYLETGDASLLSRAEDSLAETINNDLESFPQDISENIIQAADTLLEYMTTDFRAAGKLSGNPQGLLIQAERELRDSMSSLADYANKGKATNSTAAYQYTLASTRMLEQLIDLGIIRQKYFDTTLSQHKNNISVVLSDMNEQLLSISNLPHLNIMDEEDEDDIVGGQDETEQQGEDLVIEITDSIASLISRYSDELTRTEGSLARVKQSQQVLQSMMDKFDSELSKVITVIESKNDKIHNNIVIGIIVMILIMLSITLFVDFIQRTAARGINSVMPVLEAMAKGDFTGDYPIKSSFKELDQLDRYTTTLQNSLSDLINDVQNQSVQVRDTSQVITESFLKIVDTSQNLNDETLQSSAAINEMAATVQEVARSAVNTANAAVKADESAQQGNAIVEKTIDDISELSADVEATATSIQELHEQAQNIGSILTVIESIADQTNLLALNAAIEAARAGEQGRGFAVVADEVRELAHRTSGSTQEIIIIIEKLQSETTKTVEVMNASLEKAKQTSSQTSLAGTALNDIVKSIQVIRDGSAMIAQATEQQAAVSTDINNNIALISTLNHEAKQAVDITFRESQNLDMQSDHLNNSMQRFSVS